MLLFAVNLLMVSSMGTNATSAVGIFSQPKMVILCVTRSISVAISARIAALFGQGEIRLLQSSFKQICMLTFWISALILLLSLSFLEPILNLAGAKTEYMVMALQYAKPTMVALFFTGLSTVLSGGLLGVGQTKIILAANAAGNVVSVLFSAVLIYGWGGIPSFGVAGAGYGTLSGAVVTFLMLVAVLLNPQNTLHIKSRKGWRPQKKELSAVWEIFTGTFTEQGVERVGMFLYSRMTADLGTVPFAVHTICMNLCDMYYSFAQGMGKASLVLAGQTLGAKDLNGFEDTAKIGQKIGFLLSALAFFGYTILRMPLIGIYDSSSAVLALGGQIMLFVAVVSVPEAHALICAGTLRGAGKTRFVAVYSLISIAVIRPILTWILCFHFNFGLYGAWSALLFDQITRAVCADIGVRFTKKTLFAQRPACSN